MRKKATPHNSPWQTVSPWRAFTLIELLVVITIIGILSTLILNSMNGAITAAKRLQAKNDVMQIATAITSFQTDYGRFPTNLTSVSGALLDSLIGLSNSTNNDNPRQIVYLDVQAARKGKSGTNANGFVDPFDQTKAYAVAMDTNYVNNIGVSTNGSATTNYTIRKQVGVWNIEPANTHYQVRSWE